MDCDRDRDPNTRPDMMVRPVRQTLQYFRAMPFYFSKELAFLYLKYRMGENAMSNFFPPKIVKGASPKFENHSKVYFYNR